MFTGPIESHHPGKFVLLSLRFVTANILYLLLSQYFSSLLLWLQYICLSGIINRHLFTFNILAPVLLDDVGLS